MPSLPTCHPPDEAVCLRERQDEGVVTVRFDEEHSRLMVGAWSARASWVHASSGGGSRDRAALLGIGRGLNLLVESADDPDHITVEAWESEPGDSDGIAVVVAGDTLVGTANIPLCSCGDRGCGNAGVQLLTRLPAQVLPGLVDLLRSLPTSAVNPTPGRTWTGALEDLPVGYRAQLIGH